MVLLTHWSKTFCPTWASSASCISTFPPRDTISVFISMARVVFIGEGVRCSALGETAGDRSIELIPPFLFSLVASGLRILQDSAGICRVRGLICFGISGRIETSDLRVGGSTPSGVAISNPPWARRRTWQAFRPLTTGSMGGMTCLRQCPRRLRGLNFALCQVDLCEIVVLASSNFFRRAGFSFSGRSQCPATDSPSGSSSWGSPHA